MTEQPDLFQPQFDGEIVSRADTARLRPQLDRVREIMLRGGKHTLVDLERATGSPGASISARLRDLRKVKFGEYDVRRERVGKDSGTYVYWIEQSKEAAA